MSESIAKWIMVASVILIYVANYGVSRERDELKAEAVKRGFAEWVVNDKGNTTFKWKDGTK